MSAIEEAPMRFSITAVWRKKLLLGCPNVDPTETRRRTRLGQPSTNNLLAAQLFRFGHQF
jgi:hypothetical protein